jgi:mannose-6-phosphate isomerase-like protein (cupin superfamily)
MKSMLNEPHSELIACDAKKWNRRILFFSESTAKPLQESGMMENSNSPVANAGLEKMREAGLQNGFVLKSLFEAPDGGLSLTYVWFKGNYPLPAHKHNTQCLYYVISGAIHMGKRILKAREGFFLPAEAGYSYSAGPEGVELLEIRNSTHFDITMSDATEKTWERLAKICADNQGLWSSQLPPTRSPSL